MYVSNLKQQDEKRSNHDSSLNNPAFMHMNSSEIYAQSEC